MVETRHGENARHQKFSATVGSRDTRTGTCFLTCGCSDRVEWFQLYIRVKLPGKKPGVRYRRVISDNDGTPLPARRYDYRNLIAIRERRKNHCVQLSIKSRTPLFSFPYGDFSSPRAKKCILYVTDLVYRSYLVKGMRSQILDNGDSPDKGLLKHFYTKLEVSPIYKTYLYIGGTSRFNT